MRIGTLHVPSLAESAHLARDALDTGRALGIKICLSPALRAEIMLSYAVPAKKEEQISMMEMVLDPEALAAAVKGMRDQYSQNAID